MMREWFMPSFSSPPSLPISLFPSLEKGPIFEEARDQKAMLAENDYDGHCDETHTHTSLCLELVPSPAQAHILF